MAESREIVIKLQAIESGVGKSTTPTVDDKITKTEEKADNMFSVFAVQIAQSAINEGLAWADYELNKYLTLSDNYIAQRDLNVANQIISKTTSTITSIAQGALFGSTFGPAGAVVGAIVAGGISAAQTARQITQAQEQQQIMLDQMNAQLNFTRNRIGFSIKAASIGEDL